MFKVPPNSLPSSHFSSPVVIRFPHGSWQISNYIRKKYIYKRLVYHHIKIRVILNNSYNQRYRCLDYPQHHIIHFPQLCHFRRLQYYHTNPKSNTHLVILNTTSFFLISISNYNHLLISLIKCLLNFTVSSITVITIFFVSNFTIST